MKHILHVRTLTIPFTDFHVIRSLDQYTTTTFKRVCVCVFVCVFGGINVLKSFSVNRTCTGLLFTQYCIRKSHSLLWCVTHVPRSTRCTSSHSGTLSAEPCSVYVESKTNSNEKDIKTLFLNPFYTSLFLYF